MAQISDFMKQLYEYYYLKKNGIEKKQKNISSDLLESFAQQITKEDIFPVDEYTQSFNWDKYSKGSDACQEENELNYPQNWRIRSLALQKWISSGEK